MKKQSFFNTEIVYFYSEHGDQKIYNKKEDFNMFEFFENYKANKANEETLIKICEEDLTATPEQLQEYIELREKKNTRKDIVNLTAGISLTAASALTLGMNLEDLVNGDSTTDEKVKCGIAAIGIGLGAWHTAKSIKNMKDRSYLEGQIDLANAMNGYPIEDMDDLPFPVDEEDECESCKVTVLPKVEDRPQMKEELELEAPADENTVPEADK